VISSPKPTHDRKRSRTYTRALARRGSLLARFDETSRNLIASGCEDVLLSFTALLSRGVAAVNMSIPNLLRFLEEGRYLNIYEFVRRETRLHGRALEEEVQRRLKGLGPARLKIDRLFGFRRDTHYASLNLGGPGPQRYGPCCVVFDLRHWAPFHTCFAGDSIRACFDGAGRQVLEDREILEHLGIGEDAGRLAVIRHREFLARQRFCVDPAEVRDIVEAQDSLLEIHLHGSVTRDHIQEVRLSRTEYHHLRELSERYDLLHDTRRPLRLEFERVPLFRDLTAALKRHRIPLLVAEGS
jgi:hypothetical protein